MPSKTCVQALNKLRAACEGKRRSLCLAPRLVSLTCPTPACAPRPRTPDIDELANPLQAALVSAICFVTGAALPLLSAAWVSDPTLRIGILAGATTGECHAHLLRIRCSSAEWGIPT
jgi:hypothetical protein